MFCISFITCFLYLAFVLFIESTEKPRMDTLIKKIIVDENSAPSELELRHPEAGGFVNGGYLQLSRPNFFLLPQRLPQLSFFISFFVCWLGFTSRFCAVGQSALPTSFFSVLLVRS